MMLVGLGTIIALKLQSAVSVFGSRLAMVPRGIIPPGSFLFVL